jgi:hypothetical protein
MSTVPVFRCKYCGRPVYVTSLRTSQPDPDGELLGEFMQNLKKIAMCRTCRAKYNYMAEQGRSDEFIKGMLSPINLDNLKG